MATFVCRLKFFLFCICYSKEAYRSTLTELLLKMWRSTLF